MLLLRFSFSIVVDCCVNHFGAKGAHDRRSYLIVVRSRWHALPSLVLFRFATALPHVARMNVSICHFRLEFVPAAAFARAVSIETASIACLLLASLARFEVVIARLDHGSILLVSMHCRWPRLSLAYPRSPMAPAIARAPSMCSSCSSVPRSASAIHVRVPRG